MGAARDRGRMTTTPHVSIEAGLRAGGFVGRIVEPADAEYDGARMGWNGAIDRFPAAVALATDAEDVTAAIRFAPPSRLERRAPRRPPFPSRGHYLRRRAPPSRRRRARLCARLVGRRRPERRARPVAARAAPGALRREQPHRDERPPGHRRRARPSRRPAAGRVRDRRARRRQPRGPLEPHGCARRAPCPAVDVVVLQQGPSLLPESQESLRTWATMWADLAREHGIRPALLPSGRRPSVPMRSPPSSGRTAPPPSPRTRRCSPPAPPGSRRGGGRRSFGCTGRTASTRASSGRRSPRSSSTRGSPGRRRVSSRCRTARRRPASSGGPRPTRSAEHAARGGAYRAGRRSPVVESGCGGGWRTHADREGRRTGQPHLPGLPGPGRGAGTRPDRRPDGPAELHGVLPPAAHRPRADRGAAVLPRPAARRDRRARDDADQRRRADDAWRPTPARCRAPSRRGSSAAGRSSSARPRSARSCSRTRRRGRRRRSREAVAADSPRRSTRAAARCRASAIPSTGRSTRAPSASSSWRTQRGVSGPHVALARAFRDAVRGGLGQAADDERLDADRGRAARPRLPGRRGEGGPAPRAHGRASSRIWPRSSEQPIGFLMARRAEEAIDYERRRA